MTLTKSALLGASDLVTREVVLPSLGDSVTVRSLPAAYSNQAMSEALEVVTGRRGEQTARVNTQKLEELQVLHGLIDPKLDTVEEVRALSMQIGASWRTIVETIDAISGIDKAAIERAEQTFPAGGEDAGGSELGDGAPTGNGRSDLPVRAGA
jgi:hypothetical protein